MTVHTTDAQSQSTNPGAAQNTSIAARRAAMAIYSKATLAELSHGLETAGLLNFQVTDIRPADVGLVMLRGRMGGTGQPFNLGEATVTRAAVQVGSSGVPSAGVGNPKPPTSTGKNSGTGFSYILGRAPEKARLAALADALWQQDEFRDSIKEHILSPVRARIENEQTIRRTEVNATTVDFFTMVRGDD